MPRLPIHRHRDVLHCACFSDTTDLRKWHISKVPGLGMHVRRTPKSESSEAFSASLVLDQPKYIIKLIAALLTRVILPLLAAQEGRMARVSSAEQDAGFNPRAGVTHRLAVDVQAALHALKPRRDRSMAQDLVGSEASRPAASRVYPTCFL